MSLLVASYLSTSYLNGEYVSLKEYRELVEENIDGLITPDGAAKDREYGSINGGDFQNY